MGGNDTPAGGLYRRPAGDLLPAPACQLRRGPGRRHTTFVLATSAASGRRALLSLPAPSAFSWWSGTGRRLWKHSTEPPTARRARLAYYQPLIAELDAAEQRPAGAGRDPSDRPPLGVGVCGPGVPACPRLGETVGHGLQRPLLQPRAGCPPRAYRSWLLANGVSFVALADAPLDYAATAEAALLRSGAGQRPPAGLAHRPLAAVEGGRQPRACQRPGQVPVPDAPVGDVSRSRPRARACSGCAGLPTGQLRGAGPAAEVCLSRAAGGLDRSQFARPTPRAGAQLVSRSSRPWPLFPLPGSVRS